MIQYLKYIRTDIVSVSVSKFHDFFICKYIKYIYFYRRCREENSGQVFKYLNHWFRPLLLLLSLSKVCFGGPSYILTNHSS